MNPKLLLVSGAKWCLFVTVLLVIAFLISLIKEEYPKTIGYQPRKLHVRSQQRVKLEGPNMASIEEQVANLTNQSICVDYRTFNWTAMHEGAITMLPRNSHSSLTGAPKLKSLSMQDVMDVEKFVLFVGYPRSGHSIVGSMMDAHPNMIIAHEYKLFYQLQKSPAKHSDRLHLYNLLFRNSAENAVSGWRSKHNMQKGYTLGVDSQWQANFTRLKVIGDKSGAATAQEFEKDPEKFMKILEQLKRITRVPIRIIHVVRNPYDMISTRLLYEDGGKKTKLPATEERKHCNDYGINYHTNRTFCIVQKVDSFLKRTNLKALDVHHADLIREPRKTISMVCRFLNLPCPEDYLDACEKKAYSEQPKTRLLVSWPEKLVEMVHQLSRPYSFLWRYSFEGD